MDTLLLDLVTIYNDLGENFRDKLVDWKRTALSSVEIRKEIEKVSGLRITNAEASFLFRSGLNILDNCKDWTKIYRSAQERDIRAEKLIEKMNNSNLIKLTPDVKASLIRLGNNRFVSRYGSVEWSIVMIDGQPHLARKDLKTKSSEASENE